MLDDFGVVLVVFLFFAVAAALLLLWADQVIKVRVAPLPFMFDTAIAYKRLFSERSPDR